ncbi:hypothetical protein [Actinomycetospora soli]|uniref:hypothetical protein n=1 Tax=Actinomycetospora soli TaxID=2893887 RepID=UPI001E5BA5D1|nr:hypothetical protein [Actinomycetospora soli]MCD2191678.1 hypothetical protein [Actinomycetospora soli]
MRRHPVAPDCCGVETTDADRTAAARVAAGLDLRSEVLALLVVLIGYACPACGWWAGCPATLLKQASRFHDGIVGPIAWDELHTLGYVHPRVTTDQDDPRGAALPIELDLVLPDCAASCDCTRCRLVPATVTDLAEYRRSRNATDHDQAAQR